MPCVFASVQPALIVSISAALVSAVAVVVTWNLLLTSREAQRFQSSVALLDRLEATRSDRTKIRTGTLPDPLDWSRVDAELVGSYDRVARAYDTVAIFDRLGMSPEDFIDAFFATTVIDLWDHYRLREYVEWTREGRGATHYWDLLQYVSRIEFVAANHPAHWDSLEWTRHPRKMARSGWNGRASDNKDEARDT